MFARLFSITLLAYFLIFASARAETIEEPVFPEFSFKESDFDSLKNAITKRTKWEVPELFDLSLAPMVRRVFFENNELREFALNLASGGFVFSRREPAQGTSKANAKNVSDFIFNYQVTNNTDTRRLLIEWSRLLRNADVPIVKFNHSRPGTGVPSGGYVTDPKLKNQLRLFLNSEEDSQMVLFFPSQKGSATTGFMFCPRYLSTAGNFSTGRFLEPSDFELTGLTAEFSAEVLAKLLEGYGPGISTSSIRIESEPKGVSKNFEIKDYNEGYFPESVVVLPENKQIAQIPFAAKQLNQIGVRVDVTLTDSGSNQLLLSFKRSIGVLPFQLTSSEPLTAGQAKLSTQPGQCYLAIQRLWFSASRVAGNKEIVLPQ